MKYFKKYPVFYVSMLLLLVFFAAGAGYDYYLASKSSSSAKNLAGKMREYRTVLSEDPTSKAIDDSEANIKKLQERLEFLIKDLTRASGDIFKEPASVEGYQLVEQLRGLVYKWRKEASVKGILMSPDMDFGFKKYVAPGAQPPQNTAVPAIWKQACVLNYINGKLFDCKSEQSPMYIISVQRELLPQEIDKSKASTSKARGRNIRRVTEDSTGDTFRIPEAITARKVGSLDTLAYKFVFAGHTDVLRRFLNKLKDFDAMLVVRSIGVKPADPTSLPSQPVNPEDAAAASAVSAAPQNNLDSVFGAAAPAPAAPEAPAAPAPATPDAAAVDAAADNRTPIVEDNISEFTVVIEYVEVVKEGAKAAAKAAAKADDEEESSSEAKDKTDAKK